MSQPLGLYNILQAWQAGQIGYRDAMRLSQADSLGQLYDAAEESGVSLRPISEDDRRAGREVAEFLKELRQAEKAS